MKRIVMLSMVICWGVQAAVNFKREVVQGMESGRVSEQFRVNFFQRLLNEHPDFLNQKFDGRTPLHYASFDNRVEVAELLIMRGADINAQDSESYGAQTPLMYAIAKAYPSFVQLLLRHGADTTIKNRHGATALSVDVGQHAEGDNIKERVEQIKKMLAPYKQQEKKAGVCPN